MDNTSQSSDFQSPRSSASPNYHKKRRHGDPIDSNPLNSSEVSTGSTDCEIEAYVRAKNTNKTAMENLCRGIVTNLDKIKDSMSSLTANSLSVSTHKKTIDPLLTKATSGLSKILHNFENQHKELVVCWAENARLKKENARINNRKNKQQEYWLTRERHLLEDLEKEKAKEPQPITIDDEPNQAQSDIHAAISPLIEAIQLLGEEIAQIKDARRTPPTILVDKNRPNRSRQAENNGPSFAQIVNDQRNQSKTRPRTVSNASRVSRANNTATRKDFLGLKTRMAYQEKKLKNNESFGSKLVYHCESKEEAKQKLGNMASQKDIAFKYTGKLNAYIQDTKVVIQTPDSTTTQDIIRMLTSKRIVESAKVSEAKIGLRPTATLKDIYLSDDEIAGLRGVESKNIAATIYNSNSWIKEYYPNQEDFLVKKVIEPISYSTNTLTLIVRIESELLNEALSRGAINYGWSKTKIVETVDPLQCYHCQNYGHTVKNCNKINEAPTCFKCAGPHRGNECNANKESFKCSNCVRNKRQNTNHKSNANSCPEKVKQQMKHLKKIDYSKAINSNNEK